MAIKFPFSSATKSRHKPSTQETDRSIRPPEVQKTLDDFAAGMAASQALIDAGDPQEIERVNGLMARASQREVEYARLLQKRHHREDITNRPLISYI